MSSTIPKLYYFDIEGRAEVTRQMFNLASIKFEDIRYSGEEWVKLKTSGNTGYLKVVLYCILNMFVNIKQVLNDLIYLLTIYYP